MPISAPAMSTSKRTLAAALEAADLQAAVAALRQDLVSRHLFHQHWRSRAAQSQFVGGPLGAVPPFKRSFRLSDSAALSIT